MAPIAAAITAAIPKALMAIVAKIFSEKFVQAVLEKIIIYGLEKLSKMSKNTIDDEIVADIKNRLQEK